MAWRVTAEESDDSTGRDSLEEGQLTLVELKLRLKGLYSMQAGFHDAACSKERQLPKGSAVKRTERRLEGDKCLCKEAQPFSSVSGCFFLLASVHLRPVPHEALVLT